MAGRNEMQRDAARRSETDMPPATVGGHWHASEASLRHPRGEGSPVRPGEPPWASCLGRTSCLQGWVFAWARAWAAASLGALALLARLARRHAAQFDGPHREASQVQQPQAGTLAQPADLVVPTLPQLHFHLPVWGLE